MAAKIARLISALVLALSSSLPSHAQRAPASAAEKAGASVAAELAAMQRAVDAASAHGAPWTGPRSGPPAWPAAGIALVAEDLRNGGILGVAQGVKEAADVIGWRIQVFDAGGTPSGRRKALADAYAMKPDGVILVGADAAANRPQLLPFAERGQPIVGWHVGPLAGALTDGPVAMNVSTDPLDVARVTAMAAVTEAGGRGGVVVFTDSNFAIAMAKAKAMEAVLKSCAGCTLLETRDVPISRAAELMPAVTAELLKRYGKRWTIALAINDIYFDYAVPEFTRAGRRAPSMRLLSAGDGSAAALLRIRAGALQSATVAEPLNMQGWQLVDELNRLLASRPVTGFVYPVHLVTADNIGFDGGPRLTYDPDNGYRDIYRGIWKR